MATTRPPVRLNATVSDGRLRISFSYLAAAQAYKEYLQKPENSYSNEHQWEIAVSAAEVSMNIPSDISFVFPSGSKNAVLTFEDEAKATKWEEKMVLWERKAHQAENTRSISQSMTIECLSEKLGTSFGNSESSFGIGYSGYQFNAPLVRLDRKNVIQIVLRREIGTGTDV